MAVDDARASRPPIAASRLAEVVGGSLRGDEDPLLSGAAPLDAARGADVSFLARADYRAEAAGSQAGCIIVGGGEELPGRTVIVAPDPHRAFALALQHFHPPCRPEPGVDPASSVDPSAEVAPTAHVGPLARVGARARVGDRSVISPGAVVGPGCEIGTDVLLHPGVVLGEGTVLGDRVIVQANAVIGSDGFGFVSGDEGHLKVPHVGRVVVEDDVEIGACTCVDRAVCGETRIGAGTKIDNLVQVAHNVSIGPRTLLVSQAGIAGSTKLGAGCVVAGQSGIAGHLRLGPGARVGAKSAVYEDVGDGQTVTGIPAVPHGAWRRQAAVVKGLPDWSRRLRRVERKLGLSRPESGHDEEE